MLGVRVLRPFAVPATAEKRIIRVAAANELQRRRMARHHIHPFYSICEPDYIVGDFLQDLIGHLEWAAATPDARLMIFAPPRHGKSVMVSKVLPTWLLGKNPRDEIMLLSGTQDLSDEAGRYVRNKLNDPVIQEIFPSIDIDPSANAVDRVVLRSGGGFRAVGVGGQIVGRGANWLIIDDPYKNRAQAYSANEREKLFNWYRTDARTRLAPEGRVILMHQRWHMDDLASKLLKLAETDKMADQWRVVIYSATCENPDLDPLGRELGWPLDPIRWPISRLYPLRANATESEWQALYQQRPVREEGGFFKADWFQTHSGMPAGANVYIGWDGAASVKSVADKSAIVPIGFTATGDSYIAPDFVLARINTLEACDRVLDLVAKHKALGVCVEKGMFNSAVRPVFEMRMRERRIYVKIYEISRSAGKHVIAAPLQARMEQRRVWWPDTEQFRREVRPEFLNFIPDADNDEDNMIDGCANVYQAMEHFMIPMPPPPVPEISQKDEEEERWAKILSSTPGTGTAPFTRLNGMPLKPRK